MVNRIGVYKGMMDKLLMMNKTYKNKAEEVTRLKETIERRELEINNKNSMILKLKEENEKLKSKLETRDRFRFISFMVIQMKKLEDNLPRISKKERNEVLWHDFNKIYIDRKKLDDFLLDEEMRTSKTRILEFLRLMSVIESEGDRFTKKVSINGKYKRMIILNRNIMRQYINE